jgi:hypothetical protein
MTDRLSNKVSRYRHPESEDADDAVEERAE